MPVSPGTRMRRWTDTTAYISQTRSAPASKSWRGCRRLSGSSVLVGDQQGRFDPAQFDDAILYPPGYFVDRQLVSAPNVVSGGQSHETQITGSFTANTAETLAEEI